MLEAFSNNKITEEQPEIIAEHDKLMKMTNEYATQQKNFNGRMSPMGKEDLFRNYIKGMTIKDLSLKYGILPQRVKAIIYQKHIYWTEVYPKLGETHMRFAFERELFYADDFPFVDYGIDLDMMSMMEQGIHLHTINRSDNDSNPPKEIEEKVEDFLSKQRTRRFDQVPETFEGKGGKGYILKNWIVHRGKGAAKVSKTFREAVRLTGSAKEHQLGKRTAIKMKSGGPRVATMGNKLKNNRR